MKRCPACAEEIRDEAAKCRYCGEIIVSQHQVPPVAVNRPVQGRNSGMAIASLVSSIAGIFCCYFILPMLGILLGFLALNEINRSGGTVGGDGLAKAGIIVGIVAVGLDLLYILIGIPIMFMGLL